MWKSIRSIQSGDDKSARSNRSRLEGNFEQFYHHKSIDHSPDTNRSFCFDYLQKRRNDFKNLTYDSKAKSQKSIRYDENGKEDMFTSMRNVLSKDDVIESKITIQKEKNNSQPIIKSAEEKKEKIINSTNNRLRNLKKQQAKLKQTLQNQFNVFKNMFLRLQNAIYSKKNVNSAIVQEKGLKKNEVDIEFLGGIIQQAFSIEKYFAQMDRKKQTILKKLTMI